MSDLHFAVPSSTTLILSLCFALILLAVIRTALFAFGSLRTASNANEKLAQRQTHQDESRWLPSISPQKWSWKLDGNEAGVTNVSAPTVDVNLRIKSAGPAFDHPLPAIYETEIPVSMAKMIMSRHTCRRPTPPRPPRRIGPAARRVQSMV